MKYSVKNESEFQILGISRRFRSPECFRQIPLFWEEYYRSGRGEIACGQFGCCYDEAPDGSFSYAIGNRCRRDDAGVYHIFNCPERREIPAGFQLITVPAAQWLSVECRGPLPEAIQQMHQVIHREWPAVYEPAGTAELEEYLPRTAVDTENRCFIRIPVRCKFRFLSLRENPQELERFCTFFSANWGHPELYRDCFTAALTAAAPLPQWFLAVTPENEIAGGCGLITNDFISRMDLWPWLCALFVEEKFRRQGLGGALIDRAAAAAAKGGFPRIYCATDHIGYYERYGFSCLGTGYHPWGETSRIYGRESE